MNDILNQQRISEVFGACIAASKSAPGSVLVDGITFKVLFERAKLEANRETIIQMLNELPDSFKATEGGASFLLACMDRVQVRWASIQDAQMLEMLFMLGMGIKKVRYKYERGIWPLLPQGMPILVIDT